MPDLVRPAAAPRRAHARLLGWALPWVIACVTSPAPDPPTTPPPATPAVPVEPTPAVVDASPPTDPPTPAPSVTGYTPEVAAILAESSAGWWLGDTRIALARRGAVRTLPDGPALGLHDHSPFPAPKRLHVIEDSERPRIVTDDRDVRLLLYVDRQDARPVVLRPAPLRPTPETTLGDPPRRGHVVLQPGAWVDVKDQTGSLAKVVLDEATSGWLDAEALGTTVTLVDAADERPRLTTRRATGLLLRPKGKALVELEAELSVIPLAPAPTNGYRLVEHRPPCNSELAYVGFVRERDLYQPNYGSVIGCGSGGGRIATLLGDAASAPRVILHAGNFLVDVDQPVIVGCVLEPAEVAELGDGRYAVATIWGPIPVRLAPEGFEGRCGP